jgi:hypothetical protein
MTHTEGRHMPGRVYVGTSGGSYRAWDRTFYPRQCQGHAHEPDRAPETLGADETTGRFRRPSGRVSVSDDSTSAHALNISVPANPDEARTGSADWNLMSGFGGASPSHTTP